MDEMTNEVIEEQVDQIAENTELTEMSEEEFDAIWDDEDGEAEFVEEEVPEEADQPNEEQPEPETAEEAEETEQPEQEAKPEDTDQYLELKHFDEVRKVSKEEAKVLAQKGMDYDRIRGKLSEAETANSKLQQYESFLNEIKGDNFESIDDLMADTRARLLSDKENISYEDAKKKIVAQQQAQAQQQQQQPTVDRDAILEELRRESLTNFLTAYPNVKAKDIPQEVWDDMRVTNNLIASYAKYEAKKLAQENEILKNNAKNKARSTGSMRSSGKAEYAKSEFDRILEDDDY